MAFFRIPCHRELIEGDRVHAHDQSLDRGVSADAFGELCWLPDQLPDSLRSGARLRMCTIHDGEPELARLPRLRKSQIKGLLVASTTVRPCATRVQARLEGIVSKRLGSPYRSGRSRHWVKSKNPAAPAVKREAEEDWAR